MATGDLAALLKLERLGKDYGGRTALSELTCEVQAGEIVGLLGPNGAGKTTTMKLLLGMLRPTRGSANILGFDCTTESQKVKARVGYTPDEPAFYDFLTGRETIDFVLQVRGTPREEAWTALGPIVETLEFGAELDVAAGGYSHGMKKKLALLLAVAHRPALLLLDEPTNGLDPPTASRVRAMLRSYAGMGAAIIVSTHLLDMADNLCNRVLVLHHGKLIAQGAPSDVRAIAQLPPTATLEEAFLKLVS